MSRFNIFFLCSILIIGLILISGCSGIQGTSPTQTSTDTMTPIPTATATAIPTVTNTPPPPFVLTPCVFRAECPEANPLDKILESPAANGVVNQVEIPYTQAVQLTAGWIAKDEATLQQNLPHVHWFITVDGQNYYQENWLESGVAPHESGSSTNYPGRFFGVELSGWTLGQAHFIRIGYILDSTVNNGWESFDAGYTYVLTWYVKPVDSATPTPKQGVAPTAKPRPSGSNPQAQPTATTASNLVKDVTLRVQNNCDVKHTVVFSGPMTIKYVVAPGQTVENQVVRGTYTWMMDNSWKGGPADLSSSVWTLPLCP